MIRFFAWLLVVFIAAHCVGCGQMEMKSADSSVSYKPAKKYAENRDSAGGEGWENDFDSSKDSEAESGQDQPGKVTERKIIYTASLEVVVEQFDDVQSKISKLVDQNDGFISSANIDRMTGERRSGRWTVRIPVANYREFLDAVGGIGVPAARNENASDVTEEFVDIEARIANKKKLEARIVELLERPDDKIQHVIEVERELARVREAIERMEGRMRYLADATSLTTVDIFVREERDYVPPQALTLGTRINNAWTTSLTNCRRFFEDAVVFIVANAIGFGIFLLACLIAIPVLRRLWKRWVRFSNKHEATSAPTT